MTADRARGALAVLQDADGKFICEVPCGYIVEQTASAHKPRRIQAQRRRWAMLRRRVALTVALLTVAALLAALMPWSGSGAADKPKDTTAGTLEEVHQPTAVLLPSSGTVAEYVPNAAEVEALAKLIYGEAGIVPSTTEQAAVVWCVLNRVDDPRFPDTVLEVSLSCPGGGLLTNKCHVGIELRHTAVEHDLTGFLRRDPIGMCGIQLPHKLCAVSVRFFPGLLLTVPQENVPVVLFGAEHGFSAHHFSVRSVSSGHNRPPSFAYWQRILLFFSFS